MQKILYIFFLFLLITLTGCSSDETTKPETENGNPQDLSSTHFSCVLYDGLSNSIVLPILSKLETNYNRVTNDLAPGVSINKTMVSIWNDNEHFLSDMQKALGVRYPGATGYVYGKSEIRILFWTGSPQDALHEFCHIVSLYVNNNFGNNPRWLWESAAVYEAGEFVDPKSLSYLVQGNFPTLAELNTDVNAGAQKIYQVGYIISEYIINTWGNTKYIELIKSSGNINTTLGITASQFESGWKQYVQNKYLK